VSCPNNSRTFHGVLTKIIAHNQFVHLYGQRGARLDCDQSIHSSVVNENTLLVTLLSPFLFWAPDIHRKALDKIFVDGLVHRDHWTAFSNKLSVEWQEITIIVLLPPFRMPASVSLPLF